MADANSPSIEIVARLRDEVSAGLEKLRQNILDFAKAAQPSATQFESTAADLARAVEDASKKIEAGARVVRDATRNAGAAAPGGGPSGSSAVSSEAEQTREAQAAIESYLETLKLQSAARTLSNQEHSEALALYAAEANAVRAGTTLSQEQRQQIVEEIRAREQLLAFRAQEAAELLRSRQINADAIVRERAARDAELRGLREAILARDAERQAQGRAKDSLDLYLSELREERALLKLDANEREIAIAQRRAEDLAVRAGIQNRERLLASVRQEIQATQQARAARAGASGSGFDLLSAIPLGGQAAQFQGFVLQARAGASALGEVGLAAGASSAALGPLALAVGAVTVGFKGLSEGADLVRESVAETLRLTDALKPIALESARGAAGVGALRTEIRSLSIETGRSVDEIAGAARTIAPLQGFRQQVDALRVGVDLARSTLTQVPQALESLKTVLDAFGEGFDRARERSAQLFVATRAAESDLASFSRALASVGPSAVQFRIPLEDTAEVLAAITNRTNDAGQAATVLKTILSQAADPASALSVELRKAGVDASLAAFQTKGFASVLTEIGRVIGDKPDIATQVFGSPRTAEQAFAAIQNTETGLRSLLQNTTKSIEEQAAAIQRAQTATDSWSRVLAKLKDSTGINAIGEGFAAAIDKAGARVEALLAKNGGAGLLDKLIFGAGPIPGFALNAFRQAGDAAIAESKRRADEATKIAEEAQSKQAQLREIEQRAQEELRAKAQAAGLIKIPLTFEIDRNDTLRRDVEETVRRLERSDAARLKLGIEIEPEAVQRARAFLAEQSKLPTDKAVTPDIAEQIAAANQVVQRYEARVTQAASLVDELARKALTGAARERAERETVIEAYRKQFAAMGPLTEEQERLNAALEDFAAKLNTDAQLAAAREFATVLNEQKAAELELLKARQSYAIATGQSTAAASLAREIDRESLALALRNLDLQEQAELEKRKGETLEQEAIRKRFDAARRALQFERDATEEVRRRAALEDSAATRRTLQGVRASLGTGLSGEIDKIRQGVEDTIAALDSGLKDKIEEIQKKNDADAAQQIANAQRVAAARKEAAKFLGGREEDAARRAAALSTTEQLFRLESEVGTNLEAQALAKQGLIKLDQQRIRDAAVLNGATEKQLQELDALFAKQLARPKQELDLQNTFGSTNLPEIILRGRIEFDQAQLDADLAKKARELADELDKATEGLPRNSPEFNAAAEAMAERLRRLKFEADRANQSLSKGFRDEIEKLSLELGNDTRIGARLAEDAFRGLSSAIGDTLTQLENGKGKFRDVLASFARDLQSSINRAIGDKIAASFFSSFFLAKGGVAMNGSIIPFASGEVFDSPTLFPLRSGKLGMLGEAGPEAIMPLTRGRDGKLGVRAQAQQASAGPIITNHITISVSPTLNAIDARSGAEFLHSHAKDLANITAEQLNEQLSARVVEAVRRAAR